MARAFFPRLAAFLCVLAGLTRFSTASPAAERQAELLDAGWQFHLNEVDGNSSIAPPGIPVAQWVYIYDDNAPNDAATMAAPNLATATWTNTATGADVFNGTVGYAWFRATIVASNLAYQPVGLYFANVDDNGWVYLNGQYVGQHTGWGQPFSFAPITSAWNPEGTNILAVAVQNTGGPGGIMGSVLLQSAAPQVQPPGIPITQWQWLADNHAPDDAATMTAPNLAADAWPAASIGQDVFSDAPGSAWFRAKLDGLATPGQPLTLHFLQVADNAAIYLNGALLGRHLGGAQPFDISVPDSLWSGAGPNVLALAVQDTGGHGGLLQPVILQSGSQVPPPGVPVSQWIWLADSQAPADAGAMAATNLNTSAWSVAAPAENLFPNNPGALWLRATLDPYATGGRPLILHALNLGSNAVANVYLNGAWLGQFGGTFDLAMASTLWASNGPNVLAVALENTNGPAGWLSPVLLQSGDDIQDFSPADLNFNAGAWRTVQLPHDYVIEGTFTNTAETSHASLPLANAWYRLAFPVPAAAQGQSVWVDFDGVYHNSMVWINGHYLGYWYSGYAPFRYDLTPFVLPGGTNVLAVHVDPHGDEGWWYEGAGIYRHVRLTIANPLHVAPSGTFVTSAVHGPDAGGNASATLTIATAVTNAAAQSQSCALVSQAVGPDGVTAGTATTPLMLAASTGTNVTQIIPVANARLWSLNTPQMYQLQTSLQQSNQSVDTVTTPFGIRSIRFDVNNGFFLNGQRVEINGMCNHQDFAGVGIGMPDNLLYWRILKLKQMGANAYRCSHNPPTAALLDACDRLGMLVMDENRHLGDATGAYSSATAQTTYADLSPLSHMILRDRNHPSIVLWSMCNEEAISGTQAGADIFNAMRQRVRQFDTSRPVSCAMNGGWFDVGISLVEDVEGFNYSPGSYDSFHTTFPSQPMYGSETTSAETDRGMYTNDGVAYVSAYNSTPEDSWQPVATQPFMAGGFVWTGFDYKGEPSPYGWPCISSKFGNMDSCGLPKDDYYFYQAWWGAQPLVHIFPHWNWSVGQTVTVWCYGNTANVELFLNGVSQGAQAMPAYGHVAWSVPYAPGILLAKGYDASGNTVATNQVATTGLPARIALTTDRATLTADGEDVTAVYASILDAQGRVVPTASNFVSFAVQGPGCVAGVGNGDPASHEPDRATQRSAFNGWCMALVGATNSAGPMTLTATSPGLVAATLNLEALAANDAPAAPENLSAAAGDAQASLAWTFTFNATAYNLKRATVSGGPYTTVANYTATAFTDAGLTNGVTYYYVVSAVNSYGESANSSEVSVTPMPASPPAAPGGLTAQADDGQVLLSWNAVAGATSYNIKRAPDSVGPFTNVASEATSDYADTNVVDGTNYYYVVSAVVDGLEGSNSAAVAVSPVSMTFLVGSSIGSAGSWQNGGNIREMALDGNLATFFDPATADAWVGIDLGANIARAISKLRYAPRAGYESRMVGGVFQGANQPDFSDAVTLYTITNTPIDGYTAQFPAVTTPFRYLRYLTSPTNWGNIAELEFYSAGPHLFHLAGTVIGTSGSNNNSGDTITNAFDGDLTTYFDGPASNGDWVGLDLGSAQPIADIRFFPRIGYANLMNGGMFQGANVASFSPATTLWMLTNPPDSTLTAQAITNTTPFRYVRYLSPNGGYGDVAEIQFFGPSPTTVANLAAPTDLSASPGNADAALSWTGSSGAASYNLQRGTTRGGPYTLVANTTATLYLDTGLAGGTYYYVVSAVNAAGQSPDSAEVSATVSCPATAAPADLEATTEPDGQVLLAWTPVFTGTNAISYTVLRSTNSNGPFTLLAAGLAATNYCDRTAAGGVGYYYAVQAVNPCGQSPDSPEVGLAPLSLPWLAASVNGNQLLLSWPSWMGDYAVYAATNLAPPVAWQGLTNTPEVSNGISSLALPAAGSSLEFFRLLSQ